MVRHFAGQKKLALKEGVTRIGQANGANIIGRVVSFYHQPDYSHVAPQHPSSHPTTGCSSVSLATKSYSDELCFAVCPLDPALPSACPHLRCASSTISPIAYHKAYAFDQHLYDECCLAHRRPICALCSWSRFGPMLRSSAGCLYKGVATAANSLRSERVILATASTGQLAYSTACFPPSRCSFLRRAAVHVALASNFHSIPYFNTSQPHGPSSTDQYNAPTLERYLPPLLDIELIAQNDAQQPLITAIQHLDADTAWSLYTQLGKARCDISTSVLDMLITLQLRKPVRSSPNNVIDSHEAARQVCDRVLHLCHDRFCYQAGSSINIQTSATSNHVLSSLPAAFSLRLLYLLIVEEEQVASLKSFRSSHRRANLSTILKTLSANVDAQRCHGDPQIDVTLRGRLAATLSRSKDTDSAYHHLRILVQEANQSDDIASIDPRPFDQLLSALARQASTFSKPTELLPSPADFGSRPTDETHPIIRALRITLSTQVQASKANIHKCLQALDSATLWWLLPFELDGRPSHNGQPDDRYPLKAKWHPWQASPDGLTISQDSLDSFAERVALVLAQRGILQPSLHIVDSLQPSHDSSRDNSYATNKMPDHDLFTVILEKLAQRMASDNKTDARKSVDMHRGLSADLHMAIKVYSTAHSIGVHLDPRLNEAIVKALASCLPTSIVDLGPERSRFTKFKAHIARRNEQRGSKQALREYLRHVTTMVLARDPDLSKATLSFPAQATLLGLHMRTRDYTFSKRLYQLIRLNGSSAEFWSADPHLASLRLSGLNPLAGPDRDTFMWLFLESTRSVQNSAFSVQLYLDWLASGNPFPPSLCANFLRGLLRADLLPVVRRVLMELQENRSLLQARLARSLVASFADAGFPDLAVELVVNVSQLTASTSLGQISNASTDSASGTRDSSLLTSTLGLMGLALDRSSRHLSSNDDDLLRKILGVFEEFKLGLTHHLLKTGAREIDASHDAATRATARDVRLAYNAAMRASLSVMPDPLRGPASVDAVQSKIGWESIKSACSLAEELFKELEDLGAEPDNDSWNLRITSKLLACHSAPDLGEREAWLQSALEAVVHVFEQDFRAERPPQALRHDHRAHPADTSAFEDKYAQRAVVHPAVVAAAIDASRCCDNLEGGLRVYKLHMRHSGFNVQVEKARLMLLADLAEPHQWRNELDTLKRHSKTAFKLDKHFVQQLQQLSDAAMQRQ